MASRDLRITPLDEGHSHMFQEKHNTTEIKCAFDLSNRCTPDCAACVIMGVDRRVECSRMEPPMPIGHLGE